MNRKKIFIIITVYFLSINAISAQSSGLLSMPITRHDIMSFFQAEMPIMIENNDFIYFAFAFRGNLTRLENENGSLSDSWDALTFQGILAGQIKLTDNFSIPIFAVYSRSYIEYNPIGIPLILWVRERTVESGTISGFFAGSGLLIKGGPFEGGIFAGYYYALNESVSSTFIGHEKVESSTTSVNNSLPYKIAFMSSVNTSQLANVGKVLKKIAGFAGMGEAVEVFSIKEEQASYGEQLIIDTLNYGLDFISSKFFMSSSAELDMKVFYRRDSYDSASKTDTYGAVLFSKWEWLLTRIEGGYKHFYYISKNFESRYFDTGYVDINLGIQFHKNFSLMGIYNFDAVSRHRLGIGLHFFPADYAMTYGKDEKRGINFMDAAIRMEGR
jgi:hypothetical protein